LTSDLAYQDTRIFAAPIDEVFEALWAQPGESLLELRHIQGTPRKIGHQQQARIAYGGLDLLMIETVTAVSAPTHLQIRQQPDALRRHDPAEREIDFLDSLVTDLDAAFELQFGAAPAETQIDFHLEAVDDETQVTVTVTVLTDDRVGWLRKRRWRKTVAKEVEQVITGINDRI